MKSCVNLPGPSGKAKYSRETDSEPVLWRKGEKHFEKKSEIVPETVRLQAVGAHFIVWRRAFCIMNLRVTVAGEVKHLKVCIRSESESSQGVLVGSSRRETKWSTLDQVEG